MSTRTTKEHVARYRAKLKQDPDRLAKFREKKRIAAKKYRARVKQDQERLKARRAYQRAYYDQNSGKYSLDQIEAHRYARRLYQRDYYRRNTAKRRSYAHAYKARIRKAHPPNNQAQITVPIGITRLLSTTSITKPSRDPLRSLHTRLTEIAPAFAWRICEFDVRGRDGKTKLRVLVSGVIYVNTERLNLRKWLKEKGYQI